LHDCEGFKDSLEIKTMKIYFTNQQNKFKLHLEFLKSKKVMYYDKNRLKEKTSTIEISTTKSLNELDLNFLYNYQIFPGNILTYKTQWSDESKNMEIGDTIVQQVYLPPIKSISLKLIFGVRIHAIIDEVNRKGFSYETLEGHVEKGISIFTLEQFEDKLIFKIQTYSVPGKFLTRLVAPFFSIPYQTFCTKAALKNVKHQLEQK